MSHRYKGWRREHRGPLRPRSRLRPPLLDDLGTPGETGGKGTPDETAPKPQPYLRGPAPAASPAADRLPRGPARGPFSTDSRLRKNRWRARRSGSRFLDPQAEFVFVDDADEV